MDRDEMIDRLIAKLVSLPPERREEAMLALYTAAFEHMTTQQLKAVRSEVASQCPTSDVPLQQLVLLIDGQLALRHLDLARGGEE